MSDHFAGIDWNEIARRHAAIVAGMIHGINGETKSDLYGNEFEAEAMRKAITGYQSRLISQDAADAMVKQAIATWKFNADAASKDADRWKALYFEARERGTTQALTDVIDYVRTTAHSINGKLRREGYELLADRLEASRARADVARPAKETVA